MTAFSYNVSEETAKEFIDHRHNKKAPLTQRAFERAMKNALQTSFSLGVTPDQAIEATIDRGWQSVELKFLSDHFGGGYGQGDGSTRSRSLTADLSDTTWAH